MAEKVYGCGVDQGAKMKQTVKNIKNTEAYKSVVALGKAAGTMGGVVLYGAMADSAGMDGSVFLLAVPPTVYAAYNVAKSLYHAGNTKLARGFAHAAAKIAKPAAKKLIKYAKPAARRIHHGIGEASLKLMKAKSPVAQKIGVGLGNLYLRRNGGR